MKNQKGKAPAIQWYYKDWLSDRKLQRASAESRGVWMNLLMYMIDCSLDGDNCREGYLEYMTIDHIMRLGGCTEDQAWVFIEDAIEHKFCEIEVDKNRTFHIMSRRLSRDGEQRSKWREIKRKQRENEDKKTDVQPNVYNSSSENPPTSPIPSPTPTPNIKKDSLERVQKKRERKKRGTTIPDDFQITPEMRDWFQNQGFKFNIKEATNEFIDYWTGTGKVRVNWEATWRNGMRKHQQWHSEQKDESWKLSK